MEAKEFVDKIVKQLNDDNFEKVKSQLIDQYIKFSFIKNENIDIDIFAEKLCDYFEKVEFYTKNSFDDVLKKYMSKIDDLVGKKIAHEPTAKKNEAPKPIPRARKYYDYIVDIKKSKDITVGQVVDYIRIMMCLYAEIIKENYATINDFEYSADELSIDQIVESMKTEQSSGIINKKSKNIFDLTDTYSIDTATFVFLIIIYYYIKNNTVVGE